MIVANLTRDSQNYLTDNYSLVTDRNKIETYLRNAIIEFNKEKPKISFPLYSVSFIFELFFFVRLKDLFCSVTWN